MRASCEIWLFVRRPRSWVFRPEGSEGAGRALAFGAVEDVAVYFTARLRVRLRKLKWNGTARAGWRALEVTLPALKELGMDGQDTSVMRAKTLDLSGMRGSTPDVEFGRQI